MPKDAETLIDPHKERLTQIFNTALVSTHSEESRDSASALYKLMEERAFGAILQTIQSYAKEDGISEVESAREIIRTFRKIDQIWRDYLIQEGVDRLKG